ncbi:MAG: GIY-YIG nuclease family protein [Bacteroidales bacterium]|nr:GIY-YIG nuclease family protein [Bacteroidales bacterium]
MYSVYILFSRELKRYYTGQTASVDRRLNQHQRGSGKYTSRAGDWQIVYTCDFKTREEAMKLEKVIKSRGAKRFLSDTGYDVG